MVIQHKKTLANLDDMQYSTVSLGTSTVWRSDTINYEEAD